MKKYIILFILLFAFNAEASYKQSFPCTALQGGTIGALDYYKTGQLSEGDETHCTVSGEVLHFRFDKDGTDAETVAAHPYKIRPEDYASGGVWIESAPILSGVDISTDTNLAVTAPIVLTDDTLSITDADDDGVTKGAAAFDATDFDAVAGVVTIVDDGHTHTATSITGLPPEGTAVLSTGEGGGTKYLREDGDGTCSWQVGGGLSNVVEDVSPQLGGDLDLNGSSITESISAGTGLGSVMNLVLGTTGDRLSTGDFPIIIDHHADGQGASVSYGVYIKTDTAVMDKGAGLVVENYGFADGGTFAINSANENQSASALAAFNNSTHDEADQYNLTMLNTHGYNIINQSKGTGSTLHVRRNGNADGTLKSGAHIMIDEKSSGYYGHLIGLKMDAHTDITDTDRQIQILNNSVEKFYVDVKGLISTQSGANIAGGGSFAGDFIGAAFFNFTGPSSGAAVLQGTNTSTSTNNYGLKGYATGAGTNNFGVYAHAANADTANYGFQDSAGNYSRLASPYGWVTGASFRRYKFNIEEFDDDKIEKYYSALDSMRIYNYKVKKEIPIIGYKKTEKEAKDIVDKIIKKDKNENIGHSAIEITEMELEAREPVRGNPEDAPDKWGLMVDDLPVFLQTENNDGFSGAILDNYFWLIVQHQKKLISDLTARVAALEAQ